MLRSVAVCLESSKLFPEKGLMVNVLGFMSHADSETTIQLCTKDQVYSSRTLFPKLYLQKQPEEENLSNLYGITEFADQLHMVT